MPYNCNMRCHSMHPDPATIISFPRQLPLFRCPFSFSVCFWPNWVLPWQIPRILCLRMRDGKWQLWTVRLGLSDPQVGDFVILRKLILSRVSISYLLVTWSPAAGFKVQPQTERKLKLKWKGFYWYSFEFIKDN